MANITRKQVIERLELLRNNHEEALTQLHAIDGAIQDAEYWLSVLDTDEPPQLQSLLPEGAQLGKVVDIKQQARREP